MVRNHPNYGTEEARLERRLQQNSHHMTYEEIQSSVECPTCNGTGRISKETEAEYVALIPLTDKRLRPRRTFLYVGITSAICIVIIILLVVFLTPRSLYLKSNRFLIEPSLTTFINQDGRTKVFMTLTNRVNLTNGNFLSITVTRVQMQVSLERHIVRTAVTHPHITVGPQSTVELHVTTNITLLDQPLMIVSYCTHNVYFLRTLYMRFSFAVTATLNGQQMEATYTDRQGVDCYPTANKTTVAPMTTTPPKLRLWK